MHRDRADVDLDRRRELLTGPAVVIYERPTL